jgi:hypothetical protein
MKERVFATLDGNEAVARVAYRLSEVCAIYPITPSSPWGNGPMPGPPKGQPNIWGTVPSVVEMQSEGGAAGAVHGALQAGSPHHHLHRLPGAAVDDAQPLQNCRGTDRCGAAHCRPLPGRPGPVDFWGSQ